MSRTCDVAIVGAGFAGLAAADVLARTGLDILIFDENAQMGGQLMRRPGGAAGAARDYGLDGIRRSGLRLINRVIHQGAGFFRGTKVLGLFPENTLLLESRDGRVSELSARSILCAAGARERYLPFKGWTLPGVISTGSAQILIKGSGILPAKASLIAGSGPLPLVLAGEIASHRGKVIAVLDHSSMATKIGLIRLLPRHFLKLLEGARILAALALMGVPIRSRMRIVEAAGGRRLEAVVAARAGRDGAVVPGTETVYKTDCLAVGFGFAPNIELLLQAGCAADYRPEGGGWVAKVNDAMETSIKGVYAAGEVTGIAGARKSMIEGKIAGLAILERLGHGKTGNDRFLQKLARERLHELRYGEVLNRMCQVPGAWMKAIPDETIICRCEDVRMGEIRRWLAEGFRTPGALRKACRCGMGNCQGRTCSTIIREILTSDTEAGSGRIEPPSMRAPVKAVRLGALAVYRN